ncbi:TonB-dependent receptor [Mucilaginibacter sp. UR6-1]|uniref:TonB-dependent receptor domain-containing protein n=1 Tax=Mucilaginibacter sp. UR6-1 TaxID=1435643 RepID=UPI001E44EDC9|nr:TonB-dependent receptor [Mucilaginibacter sp. UR6-1]MCC8411196.1 TonB-dependent receptor [Mucilaginibacter sp. UR6-1]
MKNKLLSKTLLFILLNVNCYYAFAQDFTINGIVKQNGEVAASAAITLNPANRTTSVNERGYFEFKGVAAGSYELVIKYIGAKEYHENIKVYKDITLNISLSNADSKLLNEVSVNDSSQRMASGNLRQVEGTAIYAGKKTEVINVGNLNVNLATNNTRQIYSRVAGINIIEYDGGGLQLGIGGRGLNPSRVSNFNTRQNGYDISADALGYPESYYTPPAEALERIEIIRGAASLQYGTQFGGLINFQLKKGPANKAFEFTSRQTAGSFGFFNTFNSVGGTVKKLNYYAYYQYKRGDGWRPNSHFDQHGAYIHLDYQLTPKLKVTGEYTFMNYLAQLAGGLTDADFAVDPSQSVRSRNWFKVNWNLANITFDYQLNQSTKINWRTYNLRGGREALGILNYIDRPDPGGPRDLLDDTFKNYGSELRLLHQYKLAGKQVSTFLLGARVYKGLTLRNQGNADDGSGPTFNYTGDFPSGSGYRFPGTNVALFTENIFQLTEKWSVTPGARFEYISTKADGYYTVRSSPYDDFYYIQRPEHKTNNRSFVFFGLGTSYKPVNGMEVYANISQNYRSVNFNDIRVINPNARVDSLLTDEKGYTADAGIRGTIGEWMRYDLSVFYLKYNRRIGSVNTKSPDGLETYRLRKNIGDSRNIGFESLIEADILKAVTQGASKYRLSIYTNFALIDARYINSLDASVHKDNLVEFVPPVLFRTGLSFGNERFDITYQFSHVGKQYSDATNAEFSPRAIDGIVPAYQVMDLSASYTWRWFKLSGSVNNLANKKYFTRRADGYPGPGILPSDPRGYYLTLQFKY